MSLQWQRIAPGLAPFTTCRPLLLQLPLGRQARQPGLQSRGGHHDAHPRGRGGLHLSHCPRCAPRNCRTWISVCDQMSKWRTWSSKLGPSEQTSSSTFRPRLGSRGEGSAAESKVRILLRWQSLRSLFIRIDIGKAGCERVRVRTRTRFLNCILL